MVIHEKFSFQLQVLVVLDEENLSIITVNENWEVSRVAPW